ncbi:MAG TPA: hypothetical protein VFE05_14985 [Longimicrobiaceae bacterium]|jgi:hypothetical protein|nr:hypothetical protein [Longimicrobiaceae bacterium]
MQQLLRRAIRAALAAAVIAVLPACDDSTGSGNGRAGSMSFSFSGSTSGSFAADGRIPSATSSRFDYRPFAAAVRADSLVLLLAYDHGSGTRGDLTSLFLEQPTPGRSYSLDANACFLADPSGASCATGFFLRNTDLNQESDVLEVPFFFTSGTVTVTSVSDTEIEGTFSGTAEADDGVPGTALQTVIVTNGRFKMPIASSDLFGGSTLSRLPAASAELSRLPAAR